MRRFLASLGCAAIAFGVVIVLPVSSTGAGADPEPVESTTEEVPLGSVAEPAPEAEVQVGQTEPEPEAETLPTLALTRTDTEVFSTVGLTWAHDPNVVDVAVSFRVRDVRGNWGDWTDAEVSLVDAGNPAADLRGGTDPVWTGDAYGVEVEVTTRSGAEPADVELVLIDPNESAADAAPVPDAETVTDVANAAAWAPPIYSRAQWGADEDIRGWDPEYASTLRAGTVHHTADRNSYSAADVPAMLRSIYYFHAVSRGWGDIGYNFIVDRFGRIWEGRYGGIETTVVGAHAGGFNSFTVGVSMLGNFDVEQPSIVMLDSVARVLAWKFSLYGLSPYGTTSLVSGGGGTAKYAAGTRVSLPTVFGHRDVGNTTCPGRYGYTWMQWFKNRMAQLMDEGPNALVTMPRQEANGGPALGALAYGSPYTVLLSCDFDGNGNDEIAVYERGTWFVRHSWSPGPADRIFAYGEATWQPVCGDWDGDGIDGIGVFDGGRWLLRDTATPGAPTISTFTYGWEDTLPVAGDWDGDGRDSIGVWNPSDGFWLLRNSTSAGPANAGFAFGFDGALPVPGDFNGNGGTDIGVYFEGTWYLRDSPTPGPTDRRFDYGSVGYRPLTGNFDGLGGAGIAVSVSARV